jgi:hypothetical protein
VAKERQVGKLVQRMIIAGVDVAYVRREQWHPAYRRMMRAIPTVAEVNTDDRAEFKLTKSFIRRLYASFTARCWREYPAGYACVTNDLATLVPSGKPVAVISNGIPTPTEEISGVTERGIQKCPHLFFSCTGRYAWHGLDKYLTMARLFPEWQFSFAGDFPEEWRKDAPLNLKIHGKLSAADADKLLLSANIGVGTLAFHRMDMHEASILKVRSYMAAGLPSIIAYRDTDFSKNFDFICEIANTEDNIQRDKEKIRSFVLANYQRRVPWEKVSFASESEKARLRHQLLLRSIEWRKQSANR